MASSNAQRSKNREAATFKAGGYILKDSFGTPRETLAWLKDGLKKSLGWQEGEAGKASFEIETGKLEEGSSQELYELKICQGRILVKAATLEGLQRGFGRLLCIADSPLAKVSPDGSTQLPKLSIRDWPDYRLRGMYLRLDHRVDEALQRKYLDIMAKLGFNCAIFEVGGCFESETHPEFCCEQRWSKRQLKDLVAYAKARGITPWPGINCIGHLHSGPRIFPLQGRKRDGSVGMVVSDISNPQYFPVLFEMADELAELFEKPKFFHIGTDEFDSDRGVELLEEKSSRPSHELFAEFLNKTSAHFAKKGIRAVVWHDMLAVHADGLKRKEPANGIRTAKAIDAIDRGIVIDYWCYDKIGKHVILEGLAGKGFHDVWLTTWNDGSAAEELFKDGIRYGATGAFGSNWNIMPHWEALPETAEFAWNATESNNGKTRHVYETFKDIFFYGRGAGKQAVKGTRQLEAEGITTPSPDLLEKIGNLHPGLTLEQDGLAIDISNPRAFFVRGSTNPPEVPPFKNAQELAGNASLAEIIVSGEGQDHWISPTGIDKRRETNDCIVYTPAYGKTTRTNQHGVEAAVRENRILGISKAGNMEIPQDGFVLSCHGEGNCAFLDGLRPGARLALLLDKTAFAPETISMPSTAKNCVMAITCEHPVRKNVALANVVAVLSDGSRRKFQIESRMLFHPARLNGEWKVWTAIHEKEELQGTSRIICVELQSNLQVERLEVSATKDGVESGLTVLGGLQY